jgi:hypothetical protein
MKRSIDGRKCGEEVLRVRPASMTTFGQRNIREINSSEKKVVRLDRITRVRIIMIHLAAEEMCEKFSSQIHCH